MNLKDGAALIIKENHDDTCDGECEYSEETKSSTCIMNFKNIK